MDYQKVQVTQDDYKIILLTEQILKVNQAQAIRTLMEIGIENIIAYPTGIKNVDQKLSEKPYKELVFRLQNIWSKLS